MSDFYRPDTPAVVALVPHAGKEGETILAGGGQHGVVRLVDLHNAGDGVCPGALFGTQGNPVSHLQSVDFPKVVVGPRLWAANDTFPSQTLVLAKWPAPFFSVASDVP